MDKITPQERSEIMSRVRSKNTNPEIIVRSILHRCGFRFRLHSNQLPGRPDIVLPKWKTVIFVHGCFWHRHQECNNGIRLPKSNVTYWISKLTRNAMRFQEVKNTLEKDGWCVIVVWECETQKKVQDQLINRLCTEIMNK